MGVLDWVLNKRQFSEWVQSAANSMFLDEDPEELTFALRFVPPHGGVPHAHELHSLVEMKLDDVEDPDQPDEGAVEPEGTNDSDHMIVKIVLRNISHVAPRQKSS